MTVAWELTLRALASTLMSIFVSTGNVEELGFPRMSYMPGSISSAIC